MGSRGTNACVARAKQRDGIYLERAVMNPAELEALLKGPKPLRLDCDKRYLWTLLNCGWLWTRTDERGRVALLAEELGYEAGVEVLRMTSHRRSDVEKEVGVGTRTGAGPEDSKNKMPARSEGGGR